MQTSRFSFAIAESSTCNSIKNIIESFLSIESREYFNLSIKEPFQQVFSNNKTLSRNNSASQLEQLKDSSFKKDFFD